EGDEAIVEIPSWEQPRVLCQALNVNAKIIRRRSELGWKFDLDEMASMASPKVKVIYICHPNNPTGAVLTADELKAVCEIAGRHGAYVISDELYKALEWTGKPTPSLANASEWIATNGTFHWVAPQGAFLSFPSYDLDIPSWDMCLRLLDAPYRTYLVPGSCYGYEGYVRLGFGPGTAAETIRAGLDQI